MVSSLQRQLDWANEGRSLSAGRRHGPHGSASGRRHEPQEMEIQAPGNGDPTPETWEWTHCNAVEAEGNAVEVYWNGDQADANGDPTRGPWEWTRGNGDGI